MNYFTWKPLEILSPLSRLYASVIKYYLMVTRNNYFVFELEAVKILEEFEKVVFATIMGKVTSMNKNVSACLSDLIKLVIASVSVRDNNNIQLFTRLVLHFIIFKCRLSFILIKSVEF